jgi:DUF971 family protein
LNAPAAIQPAHIATFPNGELGIVWKDGHESYYAGHFLRCACQCARCVDEMTGQKTLRDDRVPQDVHVLEIHPVGNYGVAIHWSDGHDTGIYSFERLRALCRCPQCTAD